MRWCTKLLKLKPFEEYVGEEPVLSYVGIRADENREGYISHKPNLKTVFPFKEDGIDYAGVMRILNESGIGLPPYLKWGRTHSGCYFCFFQQKIEWVRLLETHPDQFDQAQAYEKISDDPGKTFTWIQGMPLSELRKPENVAAIKQRFAEYEERMKKNRGNRKLVEILADMEDDDDGPKPCLICQL
jgi:3'-phosphoadenosine 5'-phosphosulfate sulfotransferase (PAPS reductase)/FAD synthetase